MRTEDRGFQRIVHRFKSQDGLEKRVKILEAKLAGGSRLVKVGKEGCGCSGVSPAWADREDGRGISTVAMQPSTVHLGFGACAP